MNNYQQDDHNPLGYYDVDDEELRTGLGPYRPLHPIREGFTMGITFTLVVGAIVWIFWRAFS